MKTPLLTLILIACFSCLHAQETSRKSMPFVVSHLRAENKALLRRKAAPKHSLLTKVICFNRVCRGFIGWRTKQRNTRFKGYKNKGKRPPLKQPKQEPIQQSAPLQKPDTLVVNAIPVTMQEESLAAKERVFVLDEVLFEHNSARLNEKFTFRLDSLVDLLSADKTLTANIAGHTDNTGTESHNLKLSANRAQAVAEYLIESNISEKRISFEGFGSSKPVASNETEGGRSKNRRVEIVIAGQ